LRPPRPPAGLPAASKPGLKNSFQAAGWDIWNSLGIPGSAGAVARQFQITNFIGCVTHSGCDPRPTIMRRSTLTLLLILLVAICAVARVTAESSAQGSTFKTRFAQATASASASESETEADALDELEEERPPSTICYCIYAAPRGRERCAC
jgi:hypothetical protein